MAVTRIVSEIVKIDSDIGTVYRFLSDFTRLGSVLQLAKGMNMGDERIKKFMDKIEDISFSPDSFTCKLEQLGNVGVRITEREEPKLMKMEGEGRLPFPFTVWIQLLEHGGYDTRARITFEGEMNMMLKLMLKGKLEKGINEFARALTQIPYSMFS